MSLNRVIVCGNLTRDVEVKYLQSGTAVAEIGLALNDRRKNQAGEWVEETTFVDVTLWGRTAEVAGEYLHKGDGCLIEGRLKLESWESQGQKRNKLKVVGETLQMMGGKGGHDRAERKEQPAPKQPARSAARQPDEDGIPF